MRALSAVEIDQRYDFSEKLEATTDNRRFSMGRNPRTTIHLRSHSVRYNCRCHFGCLIGRQLVIQFPNCSHASHCENNPFESFSIFGDSRLGFDLHCYPLRKYCDDTIHTMITESTSFSTWEHIYYNILVTLGCSSTARLCFI